MVAANDHPMELSTRMSSDDVESSPQEDVANRTIDWANRSTGVLWSCSLLLLALVIAASFWSLLERRLSPIISTAWARTRQRGCMSAHPINKAERPFRNKSIGDELSEADTNSHAAVCKLILLSVTKSMSAFGSLNSRLNKDHPSRLLLPDSGVAEMQCGL